MTSLINATGVASILTALFALRYRYWRSPRYLGLYFAFFFGLEFGASAWLLPKGAFGPELGVICLSLAALVCVAIVLVVRYERSTGQGG